MAKSFACLVIGVMLLVGCKQNTSMIDPLPTPNLDGPVVMAPKPAAGGKAAATTVVPGRQSGTGLARSAPRSPGVPESWIPVAPANTWKWIVIHHSATPAGSAAMIDRAHRAKGWDELGYHFVIGNGTGSADGQIEVGSRWPKQKWGAHAKTPDQQFNNFGVGICLVGNFDIDRPTPAQIRSLTQLTAYLMRTYRIPPSHVIGHSDTKPTDCPGRHVSVAELRRMVAPLALDGSDGAIPLTEGEEMLRPKVAVIGAPSR